MPLPDERPRQSVANLIGRFETQSKRQPSGGTSSPRSSSVVSHITGDSAKEELKEKREWPPKSVTESADAPSEPPSSFRFKSPVLPPIQLDPQPVKTEPLPPAPPPETTTNGTSESKAPEIPPVPALPKQEPEPKGTIVSPKSSTLKARTAPSKPAQTPRPSPSAAQKVAARTTPSSSKAPTKTPSSSSPLNQPHKLAQTSQPATPVVKKVPSKLTSTAAQRPKTPIRTTVPSKSSNLYAPTAASLARARGAPSPAPSPAKKVNSSALERLSKPTASSLSRARSPATSPVVKPAAVPRASNTPKPSRGTPASAKGGKTPATPSKTKRIKDTASPTRTQEEEVGQAAAVISGTAPNGTEEDVFAPGIKTVSQPEDAVSPPKPEPEVEVASEDHQDDDSYLTGPTESEVQVVEPEERLANDEGIVSPQLETEQGQHLKREETASEATLAAEDPDHGETVEDPISDKLTALASKHDSTNIEQIVNLLETVPALRPVSIVTPPSEMQEIPDEEH